MPRGDGCATRAGRQPAEELCAAPMRAVAALKCKIKVCSFRHSSVDHPAVEQRRAVLGLVARPNQFAAQKGHSQSRDHKDEEDVGAHLTLLNCTRVTPAASGPRVSVASTTSPLPSEPTCHHTARLSERISSCCSQARRHTDAEDASWVRFSFTLLCNSPARVNPMHGGETDANSTHHCSVHHLDFPARPLRHLDRRGVLLRPSAATPANTSPRSTKR